MHRMSIGYLSGQKERIEIVRSAMGQTRPFALVEPRASFTLTSRPSPRQSNVALGAMLSASDRFRFLEKNRRWCGALLHAAIPETFAMVDSRRSMVRLRNERAVPPRAHSPQTCLGGWYSASPQGLPCRGADDLVGCWAQRCSSAARSLTVYR